jgi:hypothetical protein
MKFSRVARWATLVCVNVVGFAFVLPAKGAIIATYSAGGGFSSAAVATGPASAVLSGGGNNIFTTTGTSGSFSDGTATLTFTPNASGTTTIPGVIDLGSISLAESGTEQLGVVSGAQLSVNVNFTSPSGGNALQSSVSVNLDGTNAVATLLFNPTSTTFFPSDNVDFTITPTPNPIVINQGQSAEITGTINFVPEPVTTLALPMLAVAGLRRAGRKRVH